LVEVKKAGTCQGFAETTLPLAKISYTIYANRTVANKEISEPKLDMAFQPANESG
jgi:hypothetical protein